MRNTGYATLAVVGVAACVAVYALSYSPASSSLYQANTLTGEDMAFIRYVAKYGKSYGTKEEFQFRSDKFKQTLAKISAENSKNDNTFSVGVNKFADWTPAEFKRILSYKPQRGARPAKATQIGDEPDSVDWRAKGKVNPVKDQQQCGSCWAFSAVGAMESRFAIQDASDKLYSLSEQQLVDCAGGQYGNLGCDGGDMGTAFDYAHDNGMMQEADYPYTASDGTCAYDKTKVVVTPVCRIEVATNNAKALQAAIATGPVSVAIEADTFVFQFYSGGILNSKACGTNLDHGVVAVGYGADASGKPYYIVRNSWGSSWGMKGYINIGIVDGEGICGIQMEPVYPEFDQTACK